MWPGTGFPRPEIFVGALDGTGVLHLVLEIVGNAVDQHLAERCTQVEVALAPDGTVTVEDDGPGIPLTGENALEDVLRYFSRKPTVDGHAPHVHLWELGIGMFIVNALSERFSIETVRDGVVASTTHARGREVTPIRTKRTRRRTGTRVEFVPDAKMFGLASVPLDELTRRLEDLAFLLPELKIAWKAQPPALAAHGLRGMVARAAGCRVAQVRHRRGCTRPSGDRSTSRSRSRGTPRRMVSRTSTAS